MEDVRRAERIEDELAAARAASGEEDQVYVGDVDSYYLNDGVENLNDKPISSAMP
jgi:hypothetical protein